MTKKRLDPIIPLSLLALLCFISTALAQNIVIENQSAKIVISDRGRILGFQDSKTGKDYLDRAEPVPFMLARRGPVEYESSRVTRSGDRFDVGFAGSGIQATVRIQAAGTYFTLEVVAVNQTNLDELAFVNLPLTIAERVPRVQEWREHSETINACRNKEFGVALCSITLHAHSRTTRYQPASFRSSAYRRFGFEGAKASLVAGPAARLQELIGDMELAEGLPHPMLGGVWGKVSEEVRKSYLFVDFTEQNVDKVIELARAGGFSYIMNYGGVWSTSSGKYRVNTKNFPSGLPGIKAAMDKIHAAGLKGGAHILSGCIDKDNEYVTPTPDPRLAKDDMRILTREAGPDDSTLPLTTSPEGLPTIESPDFYSGKSVLIEDEVVIYDQLEKAPKFALSGCTRGAYGTRRSPHPAGSRVYHLGQRWGMFVADGDSTLLPEIAQNVADAINYCGFDMIYFDGLDGVEVNGPFFYYVGKMARETTRRFKREVMVQGSNLAHINWHDFSRLYTIDFSLLNPKGWVDHHCAERLPNARNNLMPAELGWFGLFLDTPASESTTPDEVEYVLAKTIGWDVPWSLETYTATLEKHGRTAEILAMSRIYEDLRLRRYFPEEIKEQLRTAGQDFKLLKSPSGRWAMHPISYGPAHLLSLSGSQPARFEYRNPHGEQRLKFRIKARPAAAGPGGPENVVLLEPAGESQWQAEAGSETFAIQALASKPVEGRLSITIRGANRGADRSSWALVTRRFSEPLNLRGRRAIGAWVFGDGSGARLNIRLDDRQAYFSRSHFVTLDFKGWKYCEFSEPSSEEVLKYPFPGYTLVSLRNFDYTAVGGLTLMLTDAPPGRTSSCSIGRIEALSEIPGKVVRPRVVVNGQPVVLPVELADNQYLDYWGESEAVLYDKDGWELRRIAVAAPPVLQEGSNTIEIRNEAAAGEVSRLRVQLIVIGPELNGNR